MKKIIYFPLKILRLLFFVLIKTTLRIFFPGQRQVWQDENIKNSTEPVVYVANHSRMHSPIAFVLYPPKNPTKKKKCRIWIIEAMLSWRKAPHWAYDDFFNGKNKPSFFKKILSLLTALILVPLLKSTRHVKVYRDKRVIETFNNSLKSLENGESLVIFPECRRQYGKFINDFHEGFTAIAKLYFKKTGKNLKFVPVYVAPKLNTMNFGKAIEYKENCDLKNLCNDLRDSIEEIGKALPGHKVITYSDIVE